MKKILIIDEDNNSSNILHKVLIESGYKTYLAENSNDGIEIAKRYFPDIIICSVQTKNNNASIVLSELLNNEETLTIPLVCITEKNEIKELRKIMNIGVDDFLVKPYENDDLLQTIKIRIKKT